MAQGQTYGSKNEDTGLGEASGTNLGTGGGGGSLGGSGGTSFQDPNAISGKGGTKSPGKVQNETARDQTLLGTAPQAPSISTDIHQMLGQYMTEMSRLGPEYQQEMNYLAPYLSGANTPTLPSNNAQSTPATAQADQALTQAEQGQAKAIEGQAAPGFGNQVNALKQYEGTIESGGGIQAELAYQKYLQTYGGLASTAVPSSIQQYITGAGPSTGGLGTPASAAAQSTANTNAQNVSTELTGGGTTGGGNT